MQGHWSFYVSLQTEASRASLVKSRSVLDKTSQRALWRIAPMPLARKSHRSFV
jgi:hypothetical protein